MSRGPSRRSVRDIADGLAGAGIIAAALLTPFLRTRRLAWGAGAAVADRRFPGDDLIEGPQWDWTHAIDIHAPAEAVWPWVAQIGADRAGFYSYQWLENLIGCQIRNADAIHPEWAHRPGGELRLHPKAPPLQVVAVEDGRSLIAYMAPAKNLGAGGSAPGTRWMAASWLFLVQPRGADGCQLISRYRCATSPDLASRLQFGPTLIEPMSFAMDRHMLIGIRQRAERAAGCSAARAQINGEIVICRPLEMVFDYVADQRNEPSYNPSMVRAGKVTPGPIGKGTRFCSSVVSMRRAAEMQIEYTRYDRPVALASITTMRQAIINYALTFAADADGTRMRWSARVCLHGPVRLLGPLVTWLGRRQEQRIWTSLKRHLESMASQERREQWPTGMTIRSI